MSNQYHYYVDENAKLPRVKNISKLIHPNMSEVELNSLKPLILVPKENTSDVIRISDVDRILFHAHELGASEISFKTNERVRFFISNEWFYATLREMDEIAINAINDILYGGQVSGRLAQRDDVNCAYSIQLKHLPKDIDFDEERQYDYCRYRVNVTGVLAYGNPYASESSLRVIKSDPMTFDDMMVEQEIRDNYYSIDGLVIVAGATGNGKSSLLDGMVVDQIQSGKSIKIIIYAQPIEAVFDKIIRGRENIVLTQSEVLQHVKSFQHAVENSLRRAAKIAVIGECRDYHTISSALEFSQTGGLVFTTLHVNNSVGELIYRMVNMFPEHERGIKVYEILEALRFCVIQRLAPSKLGGRVAVREYLKFTPEINQELRELGSLREVVIAIHRIVREKGCSMSQSAEKLYQAGYLTDYDYQYYKSLDGGAKEAFEMIKNIENINYEAS